MRFLAVIFMIFAATAQADTYKQGGIEISHAFIYASPVKVAGGYMMINNTGDTADTLLKAEADFPRVMLHDTEMTDDGIAKMKHLMQVEIPANDMVEFAQGGKHVMFMGLDKPLEVGEQVKAVLVFENAGAIDVVFDVIDRSTAEHSHSDHDH